MRSDDDKDFHNVLPFGSLEQLPGFGVEVAQGPCLGHKSIHSLYAGSRSPTPTAERNGTKERTERTPTLTTAFTDSVRTTLVRESPQLVRESPQSAWADSNFSAQNSFEAFHKELRDVCAKMAHEALLTRMNILKEVQSELKKTYELIKGYVNESTVTLLQAFGQRSTATAVQDVANLRAEVREELRCFLAEDFASAISSIVDKKSTSRNIHKDSEYVELEDVVRTTHKKTGEKKTSEQSKPPEPRWHGASSGGKRDGFMPLRFQRCGIKDDSVQADRATYDKPDKVSEKTFEPPKADKDSKRQGSKELGAGKSGLPEQEEATQESASAPKSTRKRGRANTFGGGEVRRCPDLDDDDDGKQDTPSLQDVSSTAREKSGERGWPAAVTSKSEAPVAVGSNIVSRQAEDILSDVTPEMTSGMPQSGPAVPLRLSLQSNDHERESKTDHWRSSRSSGFTNASSDDAESSAMDVSPSSKSSASNVDKKPPTVNQGGYSEIPFLIRVVDSSQFDSISGALVIVNAVSIGYQTEFMARNIGDEPPLAFRITDLIFCVVFTLELSLRLVAFRLYFFFGYDWAWNIFDFLLVAMQIMEEVTAFLVKSVVSFNFSFMRVLRILRLVRIVRIVRVLRLIYELRTIVSSIMGSLKSLAWTVILLFLIMYVVGVCLTQLVMDHRAGVDADGDGSEAADTLRHDSEDSEDYQDLEKYYGSLIRSILSLYQAISGGVDWDVLCTPLITFISPLAGLLFTLYIAFAVLALMNVVTGVFVESALKSAKEDRDSYLLNQVRRLFSRTDTAHSGKVDWEAFEGQLEQKDMIEFFESIDVDISEARGVFHLLDIDESGTIELDEFLNGCLGLHGPAKALELSALMYETRHLSHSFADFANFSEKCLDGIFKLLQGVAARQGQKLELPDLPTQGLSNHVRATAIFSKAAEGEEKRRASKNSSSMTPASSPTRSSTTFGSPSPTSQTRNSSMTMSISSEGETKGRSNSLTMSRGSSDAATKGRRGSFFGKKPSVVSNSGEVGEPSSLGIPGVRQGRRASLFDATSSSTSGHFRKANSNKSKGGRRRSMTNLYEY